MKKLTISIQKARRMRATQRRDKMNMNTSIDRNRKSLSSCRFQSPGFVATSEVPIFANTTAAADDDGNDDGDGPQGAQSENVLEENHSEKNATSNCAMLLTLIGCKLCSSHSLATTQSDIRVDTLRPPERVAQFP